MSASSVYFRCIPMNAVLTLECCEDRRRTASKIKQGSSFEGLKFRHCRECMRCGDYKRYNKFQVEDSASVEVLDKHYKPKNLQTAERIGADTYHTRNDAIYDRSFKPFASMT